MKHLLLSLLALVLLVCGLTVAASFFLKSTVEDMTREAIMSMAGPGESALEGVTFSPLTREITITGWRTRHSTSDGPVSAHAPTVHGKVTFRGVFACMPVLGTLINNADTMVPVLDNVRARDLAWSSAERHVTLARVEVGTVRIRFGLLQQYTLGLRPPFAQAVSGIHVDRLDADNLTLVLANPQNAMQLSSKTMEIKDARGTGAKSCTFKNVTWTLPGEILTSREVTLNDIRVSPALLSELVALTSKRPRTPRANTHLVEALVANGPIVARAGLRDLERTGARNAAPFFMENCDLVWTDDKPFNVEAHVRGMRLSQRFVQENALPVNMDGMEEIHLEADLASSGITEVRETGLVRLKDLADISYTLDLDGATMNVTGLVLTLRDYGLMARMARTISPDPHAASMLLKASANSLCQGDDEKGRQTCERIADFVDAPGSLTLKRRADVPPASMVELALNVLSARLGYLFEAEVTQGGASLTTQTEKIYGQGR